MWEEMKFLNGNKQTKRKLLRIFSLIVSCVGLFLSIILINLRTEEQFKESTRTYAFGFNVSSIK